MSRRPGGTQPEAERRRQVVSVRLPPDAREAIDALAVRWRCSRSVAVERAILGALTPRESREGG